MSPGPTPASPRGRLTPGDRLGRYEIVSWLGEGGMGEVYSARDPRLDRHVALKILHRHDARDDDLRRFANEARAAGSLNHPNIVAVHDVGAEDDVPYVVTELLEGETLRARLDRGQLPYRRALDYAAQMAAALDAAHVKGIWHRDVKPANAFITHDGRVKLLDFGVAKLSERARQAGPDDSTAEVGEPSGIIGTTGYMSPEQVQGQEVDHRTDIFALGSVMYEMFTGHRAFQRPTQVETLTAVLRAEPVDPLTLNPELPPLAAAIVRRCLEKNKERRFQSARDLAFDLGQLSEASGATGPIPAPPARLNRWVPRALFAGLAVATALVLWIALQPPPPIVTYTALTSDPEPVSSARFASEGAAVVYSTARNEDESGVVLLDLANDAVRRPLNELPAGGSVLATRAGELALWIDRRFILGERFVGALRTVSLEGIARGVDEEGVEGADWDPAGAEMAIIRSEGSIGGKSRLQYPVGQVLHETEGSLSLPRISPDGRHIAFVEDPTGRASGGSIWVVAADGSESARAISREHTSIRGLAWSADGEEVWFSAGEQRSERSLHAVDLQRNERPVVNVPGTTTLWDIQSDGLVLFSRDTERRFTVVKPPDETTERNLSGSQDTGAADLSPDGRSILYAADYRVYLGPTDESSAPTYLDVADAFADALSPDGRFVLATSSRSPSRLMLIPTGPGRGTQVLERGPVISYSGAYWFPDSQRVLFRGREEGQEPRAYVQDIAGGPPLAITDRVVRSLCASPSGDRVAAGSDDGIVILSMDGMNAGEHRIVPGSLPEDRPVAWSEDERFLWVFQRNQIPAPVDRIDVDSGERTRWKDLGPSDPTGVDSINEFKITSDGNAYFYTYHRVLSQLYLAEYLH